MNSFEFVNQLKNDINFASDFNLIESCSEGYYVSTIKGRFVTNEMSGSDRKYYPTLNEARKSLHLDRYSNLKTYYVKKNGTDYATASVTELDLRPLVELIRAEIKAYGGLSSFPASIRRDRPVGCPMQSSMIYELQDLTQEEIHVAFHLKLIGNAFIKGSIVENPSLFYERMI